MYITLAESPNYKISHEYEVVELLIKKSAQRVNIGDFYGDPETAFISQDERYCVMGGCGIIIYYLTKPFEEYVYHKNTKQWKEFYRYPDDVWWIEDIAKGSSSTTVKLTVESKGIYELDVYSLKLIRLDNCNDNIKT